MPDYTLYQGDCLEVMPTLEKDSVACVFADLPYGLTQNSWDAALDLDALWKGVRAAGKTTCAFVFTAMQPFTSKLVLSNVSQFAYCCVWEKNKASGFLNARRRPLVAHEDVVVFGKQFTYRPQGVVPVLVKSDRKNKRGNGNYGNVGSKPYLQKEGNFPRSVLRIGHETRPVHPTQKPVALLEWLIATYTNPGDLVLDPCFGSGTTGHACANLGRRFVGIEKDPTYFAAGKARIEKAYADAAAGPVQGRLAV